MRGSVRGPASCWSERASVCPLGRLTARWRRRGHRASGAAPDDAAGELAGRCCLTAIPRWTQVRFALHSCAIWRACGGVLGRGHSTLLARAAKSALASGRCRPGLRDVHRVSQEARRPPDHRAQHVVVRTDDLAIRYRRRGTVLLLRQSFPHWTHRGARGVPRARVLRQRRRLGPPAGLRRAAARRARADYDAGLTKAEIRAVPSARPPTWRSCFACVVAVQYGTASPGQAEAIYAAEEVLRSFAPHLPCPSPLPARARGVSREEMPRLLEEAGQSCCAPARPRLVYVPLDSTAFSR